MSNDLVQQIEKRIEELETKASKATNPTMASRIHSRINELGNILSIILQTQTKETDKILELETALKVTTDLVLSLSDEEKEFASNNSPSYRRLLHGVAALEKSNQKLALEQRLADLKQSLQTAINPELMRELTYRIAEVEFLIKES